MSCILYGYGNYCALAQSVAFATVLSECAIPRTPQQFAADLFELNCRAYSDRYGEVDEEIEAARTDTKLDYDFKELAANGESFAVLKSLFGRIAYQCSDADDYETNGTGIALESLATYIGTAKADAIKAEQQTAAALEEVERQMLLEQKRREQDAAYPHLKRATNALGGAKLGALNLRAELKAAFPGIKFSVRVRHHSSIDIGWQDGPTDDEVTSITCKYKWGTFDSMTDCAGHKENDVFTPIFGGARFVSTNREISDGTRETLMRSYCHLHGIARTADRNQRDANGEYISRQVQAVFHHHPIPANEQVVGLSPYNHPDRMGVAGNYRLRLANEAKPRFRYNHATGALVPAN